MQLLPSLCFSSTPSRRAPGTVRLVHRCSSLCSRSLLLYFFRILFSWSPASHLLHWCWLTYCALRQRCIRTRSCERPCPRACVCVCLRVPTPMLSPHRPSVSSPPSPHSLPCRSAATRSLYFFGIHPKLKRTTKQTRNGRLRWGRGTPLRHLSPLPLSCNQVERGGSHHGDTANEEAPHCSTRVGADRYFAFHRSAQAPFHGSCFSTRTVRGHRGVPRTVAAVLTLPTRTFPFAPPPPRRLHLLRDATADDPHKGLRNWMHLEPPHHTPPRPHFSITILVAHLHSSPPRLTPTPFPTAGVDSLYDGTSVCVCVAP